jgi:MarR-like DNA-binding transcriptional regulator SgrR of sgrS sRNA
MSHLYETLLKTLTRLRLNINTIEPNLAHHIV